MTKNAGPDQGGEQAPVTQNLAGTGNVIKGVAAIVALFPGVLVLLELVSIPPSMTGLVKLISFSVSGVVLIGMFLMSDRIARLSRQRVAIVSIVAVLLGAVCAIGYWRFATDHTVIVEREDGRKESVIIPLNPTRPLRDAIESMGNSYEMALQMSQEGSTLEKQVEEESTTSVIIMILLLMSSQILLIVPVVAAAWRLAGSPGSAVAARKEAKRSEGDGGDEA